jgi:hypothetical protein
MKPEEYLDRLIERHEHGEERFPVINDEVAGNLAAAEVLTRLRRIDVPPEFASRLELYIRARARNLAQQNGRAIPITHPRNPVSSNRFLVRRTWIAVLAAAVLLMLAGAGILTASARSLPGDPLYGLKQAEYQLTLTFAGDPQSRERVKIDQLQSTIVDLNKVVDDGRDDDAIRLALDIVVTKTNDSRAAVAALPASPERDAAQRSLESVLAGEEQTLRHLLNHVDWPVRLAFTRQLGVLGDPVPTLTHVMLRTQSNGTLQITLTGTHFAPHAELFIDGRPAGVMSQNTSGQLVAVISKSHWSPGEHAFGVLNPDGTATQMILDGDDQQGTDHDDGNGRPVFPGDSDDGTGMRSNAASFVHSSK